MLFELSILTTFILYHLAIGLLLLGGLTLLFRFFSVTAELKSWVWVTAFLLATLLPFSVFINESALSAEIKRQQGEASQMKALLRDQSSERTSEITRDAALTPKQASAAVQPPKEWTISGLTVLFLTPLLLIFLGIWGMGTLWRTLSVLRTFFRTQHLIRQASPVQTARSLDLASGTMPDNMAPLMSAPSIHSPMAVGLLAPTILLPDHFLHQLKPEQLQSILLHEQAHIDRCDLWVNLGQETLAILFWWSPIMRILNQQIHITRELACDMRAVKHLANSKSYAQSLVDCAHLMLRERRNILAMGLFSKKKELHYRINEVLTMKTIKAPRAIMTALTCVTLSALTYGSVNAYAPNVNLTLLEQEANHYSKLSRAEGEYLMELIKDRNYKKIDMLIQGGLNINTPLQGDGTALIIAVKTGDIDMVKHLISLGANVNQSAQGDGNPLIMAARDNHMEIAKLLISEGADVNGFVSSDETPLIQASWNGNFNMVKYLVEKGADVNFGVTVNDYRGKKEYRSPLSMAKSKKIKRFLTNRGAKK
ncbi:M56 family metallopeptidase [Temperatibacter marinus]|uniref:M56 family metallopeptidase n=1 Tax=Temperatibacter marinus TaxID=1456591 RepID=A0AA52HA37_9PROT|nr:M56 family metallopeptidase [Temperatibacter marinus]WND03831.1 M56 family metallopeptidase [Temperatibacter marinus]